jgi:hypothetical protein
MIRLLPVTVVLLWACTGEEDSGDTSSSADVCGDLDGNGGDTGNIPNVLGSWTTSLAAAYWVDNCTVSDFDETSEQDWIGAFTIKGSIPYSMSASFNNNPDENFSAAMDVRGGFTMTGTHAHDAGTLYANFSGLVYTGLDGRDNIDGNAFLGLDVDADTVIDCYALSSWSANKSGL